MVDKMSKGGRQVVGFTELRLKVWGCHMFSFAFLSKNARL